MMENMSRLKNLRLNFVGFVGRALLRFWGKTARITVLGEQAYQELREQGKPVVLLIWHERLLILPYFFRHRGIFPLVSPSRDGEIITRIGQGWGFNILRGSGSHAIAKVWVEMKKKLQQGGEVLIIPDGPKGPARKLKPGGIKLAQETGAYLVPWTYSTTRQKRFNTWDNFLMFFPFHRVVAIYGKPFKVDPDMTDEAFEAERIRVEQILIDLDNQADNYYKSR